ncbi:MAG: inositol 2-dehydrogenase [Pseudomonadota bacterium]
MIRIALLGCGRIGAVHADTIAALEGASLAVAYDPIAEAAAAVSARHGVATADNAASAISEADAVLIATSTDTHADLIEESVRAGKAVFCEKPIDLGLARVRQCGHNIAGTGVPVQVGFNRRFDASHRALRDAVAAGDIGALYQVVITSRDPSPPPEDYVMRSGGLFRDMTIHDFDLARFVLGDEPVEVLAVGDASVDPGLADRAGDIDTAMVILRTADGRQCHINNCRKAAYGYDQRVEAHGANGMLISGNQRPTALEKHTGDATGIADPYQAFFIERYKASFAAELASFVSAVRSGGTPEVSFADGERALVLAECAIRSMAEKRTVRVDEFA